MWECLVRLRGWVGLPSHALLLLLSPLQPATVQQLNTDIFVATTRSTSVGGFIVDVLKASAARVADHGPARRC